MSARTEAATAHSGQTDFGREMRGAGTLSLAEALRDRAWRTARAEAYRFQVAMTLLGFVAGMAIVLPGVLWIAAHRHPGGAGRTPHAPAAIANIVPEHRPNVPELVSAPTLTEREVRTAARASIEPSTAPTLDQNRAIETARGLIRSGNVQAARDMLTQPELAASGEAAFMLAETFDPNVLAALGVTGVRAETDTARLHYEAALAKGVAAAAHRLEALE